ncbi:MAG: zinc metallopeptidase [Cytophagaceae bacterium]|nr:zinc metallopeptidase [Cytophagaceae bacterium]
MIIVISLITLAISWFVSRRLKSKFEEYSKIPLQSGLTGKQIAEKMLAYYNIRGVNVVSVEGRLTDHYNPADRTVNLSHDVYYGNSAASAAVAAHECGHAVQHAKAYTWLHLRSVMVPFQNVSAKVLNVLMMVLIFGGMFLVGNSSIPYILEIIIACNLVLTLFALITLPVEFDASKRALAWIDQQGVVTTSEHAMAKDALKWAALTYVVVALGALAQLLYYVSLLLGRRD